LRQPLEILAMTGTAKAAYTRIRKHLPRRLVERLELSVFSPAELMDRLDLLRAEHSGPRFLPSHRRIVIDITTACDLRCIDCNRSCGEGQAVANEHLSVAQVGRFVEESVACGREWDQIAIEGGEPTLHPQLADVVRLLVAYRNRHSPRTHIQLLTNGYAKAPHPSLESFRRQAVLVRNTRKTAPRQQRHCEFNVAPCDSPELCGVDCSQGCVLPACYGLGLTRHGYYPHPICGGIDRVFGFDIGRKRLPPRGDGMSEHFAQLCRLCGFLRHCLLERGQTQRQASGGGVTPRISETWQRGYARYRERAPELTLY
jgi:hypothetical protein